MSHEDLGDLGAVGVRRLRSAAEYLDIPVYAGVSYCDAVRRAADGEALRILPGSIQVCQWAPVILGLREPAGSFETSLSPRLDHPVSGCVLAPLNQFPGVPEVVIVQQPLEQLRRMAYRLGPEHLWPEHRGRLELSALGLLSGSRSTHRQRLINGVNSSLACLARFRPWRQMTHRLFRSRLVTAGFDAVISRTLADMSVCRNSTVIPLLTNQVNISYFCTGGITWGRNRPDRLTSGWPWPCFTVATRRDE